MSGDAPRPHGAIHSLGGAPVTSLALSEEESALQAAVRELLADHSPVSTVRRLRDDPSSGGFDPEVWRRLAELGALDLLDPASAIDGATFAAGVVARELGRTLAPTPYLATAAALWCLGSSSDSGPRALADRVQAGTVLAALADQEGAHHRTGLPATTATRSDDGFALHGVKQHVPFGGEAEVLLVSASLDGALALFLVDASLAQRTTVRLMDARHRARVELDAVHVGHGALLWPPADAAGVLADATVRTTALLSAEMLGAAEAALTRTVEHLRTREQFGTLIGTFQALQHRAARLYLELELATSLVLEALRLVDAAADDAAEAVSGAKAFVSDTLLAITREGVQLHGGLGMTDEADIGLYLKRARVAAAELGDATHHRRLVATARHV